MAPIPETHPDPVKAALWWVGRGAKVFPVWGVTDKGACLCPKGAACDQPGKHPATVHGFHDATDNADSIRKFLGNPGTPNYGVRLPKGWGGFDVDGEGKARWEELQTSLGPLPVTLTIRSANGYHYIFDWGDDPVPPNLHGFIVRSWEKGYIVGIGSRHHTGVYYDAVRPLAQVAPLPAGWRVAPKTKRNGAALHSVESITVAGPVEPETIVAGQGRHDYLRDRGRYYFGLGLRGGKPGGVLYAAVDSYNQRFAEPKPPDAVERAIDEEALLQKFETDRPRLASVALTEEQVEEQVAELIEDFPAVINGADAEQPEDIDDWLVVDLLRPKYLAVLASTEGVGKSNIRLELGIRYACGHGALFDTYPMGKPGTVLVFDEENGPREEWRREEAMLASLGLTRSLHMVLYNRIHYSGLDLENAVHQTVFDRLLAEHQPQLVILDTAGAMVGEEHGKDFKKVMAFLKAMKEKHDCAIVLVVHLVKPPRDAKLVGKPMERVITDVMGQWTRSADVLMLVSETEDDNVILFRVRKRVDRSDITLKRDTVDAPDRWARVDAKRLPPTVVAKEEYANILIAISEGRGTWQQVTGYLAARDLPVPPKTTMFRYLKGMSESGLIVRDEAGVISLTDLGLAVVPARVSLVLSQPPVPVPPNPPTGDGGTDGTGNGTDVEPSGTHEGNGVEP